MKGQFLASVVRKGTLSEALPEMGLPWRSPEGKRRCCPMPVPNNSLSPISPQGLAPAHILLLLSVDPELDGPLPCGMDDTGPLY